jgi:nucleoid-associated protein YgaU
VTVPALAMSTPAVPGAQPGEARQPRAQEDLLAPSIWSDRARLLARPDVVAVELMLLVTAAVLLRQPLTEALGTAAEAPPVAPVHPVEPVSPLALVPVAPSSVAQHEPRDPFTPLVTAAQPADGAPADPTAGTGTTRTETPGASPEAAATPEATPPAPDATAPTTGPGSTITIKRGDTLGSLAKAHGVTWTVLYEANRDVVGRNPHVVRPGTVLTLP